MEGAQHNQTIDNKGSNGQIGKFKSPYVDDYLNI
jgi:hypothetical protein